MSRELHPKNDRYQMAPISQGARRTSPGILVIAAAAVLLLIAIRYASLQRRGDISFTEKERFV
jgi:hypothetical protein